jgi:uncharacterized protein (TIGR03085 family)
VIRLRAADERTRLCDLLDERGPDAPTLCEGWTTGDLAAHLVVRERSPLGAAGLFLPALAGATACAMQRRRRTPFPVLVNQIRRGGPLPPDGRLGEAVHLLEFVVHRQDVLRAAAQFDPSAPAEQDAELDAAVFSQLRRRRSMLAHGIPEGIGLLVRSYRHGSIDVRRGPVVVVVDGKPLELALWLFGRTRACRVEVQPLGDARQVVAGIEAALRR